MENHQERTKGKSNDVMKKYHNIVNAARCSLTITYDNAGVQSRISSVGASAPAFQLCNMTDLSCWQFPKCPIKSLCY